MELINDDCLLALKTIPDNSVDLVVTDPPYLIENTKAGGKSELANSIQSMNNELTESNITEGFNISVLDELCRVMKNINCYIWCNHKQIPMYIKYFVEERNCKFDILIWNKTNATPLFNNKYLTDKEYCLYFRKNAYCNPANYEDAKTVFYQPINAADKKLWKHPTIKPLNIIKTLIRNSSKENDIVLDCFMGSGTTGVGCVEEKRNFIGIEKNKEWFDISQERIKVAQLQQNLF